MRLLLAQQGGDALFRFTLAPLTEDNGLPLAVMGMLVVFVALALVIGMINLLPRIVERIRPSEIQTGLASAAGLETFADGELTGETVAVIAAAVAETMRRPHRVIRISGLRPEDLGWSLEGRMKHHQSHGMRPRDPQ